MFECFLYDFSFSLINHYMFHYSHTKDPDQVPVRLLLAQRFWVWFSKHLLNDQRVNEHPLYRCCCCRCCCCSGINQQVALDAAFCPVTSSGDPRAEGLPLDPHGNSLLSLLSAGFLCPLGDPATSDPPSPGTPLSPSLRSDRTLVRSPQSRCWKGLCWWVHIGSTNPLKSQ